MTKSESVINGFVIPGEDLLLVIPGEDPGSTVHRYPLQTPAARNGSRIKSGMTAYRVRDDSLKKSCVAA